MNEFEWDDANESHIWDRHRVEPFEAEEAFDDPDGYTYPARREGEHRAVLVGETLRGRLLAVVYTIRRDRIRVVTARDANRWERSRYHMRRRRR